jgi:hypothetical protein
MKRFLAVIAATVSAVGMIAGAVPAASAAEARINTYTDTFDVNLTGVSFMNGWYLRTDYHSRVIMNPRLTFYVENGIVTHLPGGKPSTLENMTQWYYVGGRSYRKDGLGNTGTGWQISTPTASEVRVYEKTANVEIVIGLILALPGLHRTGARHYGATDTLAQISRLLNYTFTVTKPFLSVNGFASFAVSVSTDSAGRPVSLAITGDSSDMRLSIGDAFTYNQPVTVAAP